MMGRRRIWIVMIVIFAGPVVSPAIPEVADAAAYSMPAPHEMGIWSADATSAHFYLGQEAGICCDNPICGSPAAAVEASVHFPFSEPAGPILFSGLIPREPVPVSFHPPG